jgi:hypothetical protein
MINKIVREGAPGVNRDRTRRVFLSAILGEAVKLTGDKPFVIRD